MAEWAPIWAGANPPSHADMRVEAAIIGEHWRRPYVPGVPFRPREERLWLRERGPDDQRELTPEHKSQLFALGMKIERWQFVEFIGPSRTFLPKALAQSFQWLVDDFEFERLPLRHPARSGKNYPPGWLGAVAYPYESSSQRVLVWVHLPGHGNGHVSVQLGSQSTGWGSLPRLETYLRRYDLRQPKTVMPKNWSADFEGKVVEAIERSSRLLRQVLPGTSA